MTISKRIHQSGQTLLQLVNDLLDLSKFKSGKMNMDFQLADINMLISMVADEFKSIASEKNLSVQYNQGDFEDKIDVDSEKIKQVLRNLLSNAVKYGNYQGKVRLSIEYKFKTILVRVWNEGTGFPESEQKKLFRKFSRLDIKELKEKKGTGVGLYISWKIIQLHGGKIKARSEFGKWAEFYFELPQYMDLCII